MPVWLHSLLVILFAYSSWVLVRHGTASLLWFGEVNRQARPIKFWLVVAFMALMSVANAFLIFAKLS